MKELVKKIYNKISRNLIREKNSFEDYVFDINRRYDIETGKIIKELLNRDSNSIDVGAHKGEILKNMISASPFGKHYAFEPLPHLYKYLTDNFGKKAIVFQYALSDFNGETSFNYVTTNPAYSGLKKRKYDRPEEDIAIEVEVRKLDDIIPAELPIKFIKIDVEGAEFGVLKGAINLLKKWKPVIIYEQGLGGSDVYGITPGNFFDFMISLNYKISLMEYYLLKKEPLTREEYRYHFSKGYNYYFIAY